MGVVDLDNLFRVYYEINSIKKKYNLLCNFKIDEGSYETAIEFTEKRHFHPPISKDWSNNPVIFCPDLLDYHNKIIIEYEEEVGNRRPGAKLAKKGHNREGDFDTKRDERRAKYYKKGGFIVFRIWESDKMWREKLKDFLTGLD
jgi:hypothetical protein